MGAPFPFQANDFSATWVFTSKYRLVLFLIPCSQLNAGRQRWRVMMVMHHVHHSSGLLQHGRGDPIHSARSSGA